MGVDRRKFLQLAGLTALGVAAQPRRIALLPTRHWWREKNIP